MENGYIVFFATEQKDKSYKFEFKVMTYEDLLKLKLDGTEVGKTTKSVLEIQNLVRKENILINTTLSMVFEMITSLDQSKSFLDIANLFTTALTNK